MIPLPYFILFLFSFFSFFLFFNIRIINVMECLLWSDFFKYNPDSDHFFCLIFLSIYKQNEPWIHFKSYFSFICFFFFFLFWQFLDGNHSKLLSPLVMFSTNSCYLCHMSSSYFPISTIHNLVLSLLSIYNYWVNILVIHKLQDTLVIKPPKKSPLILRMVVLLFVMVCGIYICSICLNQIGTHTKSKLLNIKVMDQPCHATTIEKWEIPYVHYPRPKTYSRYTKSFLFVSFFLFFVSCFRERGKTERDREWKESEKNVEDEKSKKERTGRVRKGEDEEK